MDTTMTVPSATGTTSSGAAAAAAKNQTLNQDQFLKLLVTQLSNQDPMNPVSDQDFSGQMAQFSSLEQMSSLNKTMQAFVAGQGLVQASALIGKQVAGKDPVSGEQIQGVVQSVSLKDGVPLLALVNGKTLSLANVLKVESSGSQANGKG